MAVSSWNVHGWVGRDGIRDPARVFQTIFALDADVVALQEAEGEDWLRFAHAGPYRPILGITRPISFGNVLLVRMPVERIHRIDLSVSGREPRGALDVDVRCGDRSVLRVIATHLGLRARERRLQAERLAGHIAHDTPRPPTVLVGDLNDWTRSGAQLRALAARVGPFSRHGTFPSYWPVLPLDRVASCGLHQEPELEVVRDARARYASDHLPLRIRLEVPDASPDRGR